MKKIAMLAVLLAFSFVAKAQNFYIENDELVWQMVYNEDTPINDIYKKMIISCDFASVEKIDSNTFFGVMRPFDFDYKKHGYARMQTPLYFLNYDIGPAYVIVECKEKRYRVTVQGICLTNVSSNFSPRGTKEAIEDYALTDGEPNQQLSSHIGPVLDKIFQEMFWYPLTEEEEW